MCIIQQRASHSPPCRSSSTRHTAHQTYYNHRAYHVCRVFASTTLASPGVHWVLQLDLAHFPFLARAHPASHITVTLGRLRRLCFSGGDTSSATDRTVFTRLYNLDIHTSLRNASYQPRHYVQKIGPVIECRNVWPPTRPRCYQNLSGCLRKHRRGRPRCIGGHEFFRTSG